MKTLLVLSALVAVAVAAPSFLAKDQKNTLPESWPDYRRDKKSPQGYFYAESTPLNIGVPAVHAEAELEHSGPTGRSFGLLKKSHIHSPTIIKKPTGYHLYRDSAEERAQADPSDNCSKQVKVKFCDGEKTARSIKEETHEDDVESSIKMAKEAIEHLQRDLKNIEQSPKSASWSERDVDMHEDIEVARKALDHIHRNFGNLESMSLHSTLLDEKPSHLINDNGFKTHEERASQWKDHSNTFKSNIEGARNMEDIVKSADNHESSVHVENIDTTKLMKSSEKNEHLLHEAPWKQVTEEMKATHERHATTETKMLSDMKTSQTEVKESKVEHTHQLVNEKSAETDLNLPINKLKDKKIGLDSFQGKASDLLASEKIATTEKIDHLEIHNDGKLRATEDHQKIELNKPAVETPLVAPATSHGLEKIQSEQHFRKTSEQEWNHENEKHLKQPKSSLIETQSTEFSGDVLRKDFDESHLHEEKKFNHFETSMKSADHENFMKATKEQHDIINEDKLMKPTHIANEKSADSVFPPFESIDSHMRWSMANPMTNDHLEKTTQMKAATDFHNHHTKSDMHMAMNHHHEPAVESSNHVGTKDRPFHAHSTKIHEHEHALNHAKAADFNGLMTPDLKTSLIVDHSKSVDFNGFVPHDISRSLMDFTGKSAMDLMQWTHKTDGGRSAYGAYGGSGSGINIGGGLSGGGLTGGASAAGGAVGVFPNAHVGGCAVPLLLSCSPSVVSGSLAKSGYGSGYGSSPAYRATEELNFHNKRDAKKTKDLATKKIIKQRTIVADKKH